MLRKGWKQKRKYGMMQEVEVLKTISELICSHFSEEQFTLSSRKKVMETKTEIWYDAES